MAAAEDKAIVCLFCLNVVPDVIVHVFMIPFTNAKSSDSDTHEWINEICFVARAHECHVI